MEQPSLNAYEKFALLLFGQRLHMRALSAPNPVTAYFWGAQTWAMGCAAMGVQDANCSGEVPLARLQQLKAAARSVLDK